MAFRHSTYHAPQRIYTLPDEPEIQALADSLAQPEPSQNVADSQEWILFDPSAASTTERSYTTSSAQTQTAGRSRISDFGSLATAARSYGYDPDGRSEHTEDLGGEEEDGELDSLDSHLHEFRAEPSVYRSNGEEGEASTSVLPKHDGLGSFRVDQTVMGEDVQEQLYAFEKYNPRRIKRRRESLELGQLELDSERAAEAERTRRIEKWRMEQSRLLVDEIQKETRRRKMSLSSERRSVVVDREQEDIATLSTVDSSGSTEVAHDENESFLNRITKKVIQDLMGIDDDLLSVIFGETIPVDDDLSTTPRTKSHLDIQNELISINRSESWEYRLVERIARELGLLVNQISDHPGAFSTYLNSQQIPLPYAGLPIIPESARDQPMPSKIEESSLATSPDPEFLPTIQTPAAIPIPTPNTSLAPSPEEESTPRASTTLSREEWERDLDIKMVFRYLRSRFTSKFQASSSPTSTQSSEPTLFTTQGTSHLATASTSETAARAARVRQHHPLITRQNSTRRRSIERRTFKVSVPASGVNGGVVGGGILGGGMVRRGSSSCASEHLSAVGAGTKRNSGSSTRHYWDFGKGGTSVGSGSLIASTGGMGSWGEV